MRFVDIVKIEARAGKGGAGCRSFRREKFVPFGGPDGGDGGQGGDIIFKANQNLHTLLDLKFKRHLIAKNGEPGRAKKQFGSDGQDLVIEVPCGTSLHEGENPIADLTEHNQTVIVAKGGKGGKGNVHFATSVNRAPQYAQPGLPGEEKIVTCELKLIAEVGLVGLPNAGKSTLLKALTNANPKIAAYPFTTLTPNLGVLKWVDREIVLADLPGIIEGASEGQGLGHDFLRHISRTKLVLHLIAVTPDEPELSYAHYKTIENELKKSPFYKDQRNKKKILVLSKLDIIDEKTLKKVMAPFKKAKLNPLVISSVSRKGLEDLIRKIQESCETE